MNRYVALESY